MIIDWSLGLATVYLDTLLRCAGHGHSWLVSGPLLPGHPWGQGQGLAGLPHHRPVLRAGGPDQLERVD